MSEALPAAVGKAKASFNLITRLSARPLLTDKITVYTDEEAGRELGGSEPRYTVRAGMRIPAEPRRWGVLGKVEELAAKNRKDDNGVGIHDAEIDELLTQAEALKKRLKASAMTFHLQALPDLLRDEADLATRERLLLPPEGDIPEDRDKEYRSRLADEILARVIVGIFDADGAAGELLTADDCGQLDSVIPKSEVARLMARIHTLLYDNTIAESVVDSPDF